MAPTASTSNQSEREGVMRVLDFHLSSFDTFVQFIKSMGDDPDLPTVEARLARASDSYNKIIVHYEKFLYNGDIPEDISVRYMTEMEQVQNDLADVTSICHAAQKRSLESHRQSADDTIGSTSASVLLGPPPPRVTVKMPTIQLPTFDGKPENWLEFKELFDSIVHKNTTISDVEKLKYLKSHVQITTGEVNIMNDYSLSGANYANAWHALCQRYDDKRKIADTHLKAIFNSTPMTSCSAPELRRIIDSFESNIAALKKINLPIEDEPDLANAMIVHMVTKRLDGQTLFEWKKFNREDVATWTCLRSFLIAFWRSLDDVQLTSTVKPTKEFKAPKTVSNKSGRALVAANAPTGRTKDTSCVVCSDNHYISKCPTFHAMSHESRRQVVIQSKLCWNCLSQGHQQAACTSKFACRECKSKSHHTLLHRDLTKPNPSAPSVEPQNQPVSGTDKFEQYQMNCKAPGSSHTATGVALHVADRKYQTILPTVMVKVRDSNNHWVQCRALLDNGSDVHFMTTECFSRLGLKAYKHLMNIKGINERVTVVDQCTEAQLFSNYGNFNPKLGFMIMDNLTGILPHAKVDTSQLELPTGCFLADPSYHQPGAIDILIGSDIYHQSLLSGKIELPMGTILVETKFGWTVVSKVPMRSTSQRSLLCGFSHSFKATSSSLEDKLNKFLQADEFDVPIMTSSPEQRFCEELFQRTTRNAPDGRFIVSMPFKSSPIALGTNFENARRTFYGQEAKRLKDPLYNNLYVAYMQDYIDTFHMTEVAPDPTGPVHYLPHHGVLKLSSTSTKLRPVFNASKKSETGMSLNDVLCVGPTVQPESFDILSRFREHRYVLIADITKMYRQIWVDEAQRDYLRILWRDNPSQPLKHYRMNTVTFGTACAPSIATRCLVQAAMENETDHPAAAAAIRNSFYVDDLNYGTDNIAEGIAVRESIRYSLNKIGMTLCKFASNTPELLVNLPETVKNVSSDDPNSLTRTLGIGFDTSSDEFFYDLKPPKAQKLTRAAVLSQIASLYDPIGWIGPVVLTAKLIMKQVVLRKIGWEECLPLDLKTVWEEFSEQIVCIATLRIPRHCYIFGHVTIELHGFSDASIQAYGAVIYARSISALGRVQVSLLTSKSRVAPKNQKTLARLELCGMTLLSKLVHRMRLTISKPFSSITLWSDSTIGIHWIALEPQDLSTFVGNRTAVIRDLTHDLTWKHIRGTDNPADVISRGLQPREIENCRLWWEGPEFFRHPQHDWPESILTINEADPELTSEIKRSFVVQPMDHLTYLVDSRFSNVRKLFNVFAYIIRLGTSPRRRIRGPLTVPEITQAEIVVIRLIQKLYFADDYRQLETQKEKKLPQAVSKKSKLIALSPFLDANDLMRVRGRLSACPEFTEFQKHPIILPGCHFTATLVRQIHEDMMHPGHQATLGYVREYYWVIRAKSVIRKIIHNCITCFRALPVPTNQLMSDLPDSRVTMTPPFTNTAVDYAGYYLVKTDFGRFTPLTKCYVSMFRCMCTGSIHLELVSDLSAKAFIAALDRFVSRRGLCVRINSDNGTCFEGTDNSLRKIVEQHNATAQVHCRQLNIEWVFTTPRAPHAGGVYEAGIKLVKHHLKRVMIDTAYSFEQFQTILCKVEAILNSRALMPLSTNPDDVAVLTPGHFLIGRPLCSIPQRKFLTIRVNPREKWDLVQQTQQKFWSLWYRDYLSEHQLRPEDFREEKKVNVGSLVLLNDSNLPPMKWILGRITQLYPGRDGVVRSVRVKTKDGEKDRHIKYLSFLPVDQASRPGECSE